VRVRVCILVVLTAEFHEAVGNCVTLHSDLSLHSPPQQLICSIGLFMYADTALLIRARTAVVALSIRARTAVVVL
jgi:hypothetical protein